MDLRRRMQSTEIIIFVTIADKSKIVKIDGCATEVLFEVCLLIIFLCNAREAAKITQAWARAQIYILIGQFWKPELETS